MTTFKACGETFCDGAEHLEKRSYDAYGDFGVDDDGIAIGSMEIDSWLEPICACDGSCAGWVTVGEGDLPEDIR